LILYINPQPVSNKLFLILSYIPSFHYYTIVEW